MYIILSYCQYLNDHLLERSFYNQSLLEGALFTTHLDIQIIKTMHGVLNLITTNKNKKGERFKLHYA